jgi:hypothetical protein
MERVNEVVMDLSYMIYDKRFHSLISCLWNTSTFVRSCTRSFEIIMLKGLTGNLWHPTRSSLAEEFSLWWQRLGVIEGSHTDIAEVILRILLSLLSPSIPIIIDW